VIIKTKRGRTKFKLRCPRFLYTLKIDDSGKAEKIKSSIPSTIKKVEISDKGKAAEKKQQASSKKAPAKK
jgi:large subunit ribosomal protein L38e